MEMFSMRDRIEIEELKGKIDKLEKENKLYKETINELVLRLKFKNEVMKNL